MEFLAKIFASRLNIGKQRNIKAFVLPIVRLQLHTRMFCHCHKMWLGIGRTTNGGVDLDGIHERRSRQNV
ncbi:hypothetical protein FQZ97_835030 [compost metagenome]